MTSAKTNKKSRREFLQASAAALVASRIPSSAQTQAAAHRDPENLAIPDTGWRLWPDQTAEWKSDPIYLPEDVQLASLPVNAPTGGWDALSANQGIPVTLPCTVEQYFWGLQGLRPYHDEYRFETSDDEVKNGAYYGVSWWWRILSIPASFAGKRIFLHIRAARQRAEVYLNQKLVGYSIMEELPFECDITAAALPGAANQLAIRITNPGGRLDWVDGGRITWGNAVFQKSHGFGGLDRALTLTAHGPARIRDAWVLNTPQPRHITAHTEIENTGPAAPVARLHFSIVDPVTARELAHAEIPAPLNQGQTAVFQAELSRPSASFGISILRISTASTPNGPPERTRQPPQPPPLYPTPAPSTSASAGSRRKVLAPTRFSASTAVACASTPRSPGATGRSTACSPHPSSRKKK